MSRELHRGVTVLLPIGLAPLSWDDSTLQLARLAFVKSGFFHFGSSSSGSLAILTAIRRASSYDSSLAAVTARCMDGACRLV